jgi:hypothetical protein
LPEGNRFIKTKTVSKINNKKFTCLPVPLTPDDLQKASMAQSKREYEKLSSAYMSILNVEHIYCHKCNQWKTRSHYYICKDNASGLYPICKECLIALAENRTSRDGDSHETREIIQKVLRMLDLPYLESLYQSCLKLKLSNEENRLYSKASVFQLMFAQLNSLQQYKGLTYQDSKFSADVKVGAHEEDIIDPEIVKKGRARFGNYSDSDLMFLETEYEDWVSRYECNTKAQEEAFQRLCFKKLEIKKATLAGNPTKDLDKTYQEWLGTANIQPRQTSMDSLADAQTLGTLLQKYEETRPLPEIDPELKDVDKIGFYIDTFFRGHACKLLGLKNAFADLYEKVMGKYTVKPPKYDEDTNDSEDIFRKVFGDVEDY